MFSRRRFLSVAGGSAVLSACAPTQSSLLPDHQPASVVPAGMSVDHRKLKAMSATPPPEIVPSYRAAVEGYARPFAVTDFSKGIDFYSRGLPYQNYVRMDLVRLTLANGPEYRWRTFGPTLQQDGNAVVNAADPGIAQSGASWTVNGSLPQIPYSYPSGIYNAYYTSFYDQNTPLGSTAQIPFVIAERVPGSRSPILVCVSDSTPLAYSSWANVGFYTTPMSPLLSYAHPGYAIGELEIPFAKWCDALGIPLEWCSTSQLDANPSLLDHYKTFVSIGHDEYWSKNMRDGVENFIEAGGNAAFFSGNTSMWQIRFAQNGSQVVCYKEDQSGVMDPVRTPSAGGPTVEWWNPLLNRPCNLMNGVGYVAGAGWWDQTQYSNPARLRGYAVQYPTHWVYANTGVRGGQIVGKGSTVQTSIIGYETDAAAYAMRGGIATPTGSDGTPSTFTILGYANLTDWPDGGGGRPGYATMGVMPLGRGHVFSAGTVNWVGGLTSAANGTIDVITKNVLRRFSGLSIA